MPPPSAAPRYRHALPQLGDAPFLTDGGIETTLIFHEGHDLPHFAAYDLLARDGGEDALLRYFEPYVRVARERRLGIVLETPTWRANPDWAERIGHSGHELEVLNRRALSRRPAPAEPHAVPHGRRHRDDPHLPRRTRPAALRRVRPAHARGR